MQKKIIILLGIIFVLGMLFSIFYYVFNAKYIPDIYRSSIRLYDPEGTKKEEAQKLRDAGYFDNGLEQGRLDGRCTSWLCSYNASENKMRGTIANPVKTLKINGRRLNIGSKRYYNAGYVKGYKEICPKHRKDCDERIAKMLSDYVRYFNAPVVDVNDQHYFVLARQVETRIDNGLAYYKIDDGNFEAIETDEILNNQNLPVRETVVGKAHVSTDKRFIALEVVDPNANLSYLVFSVDSKELNKVNIEPFPFEFVSVAWSPESYLIIEKYGDTPTGRGVVAKYVTSDFNLPWIVKQTY